MNEPYSDNYMRYDDVKRRYILTQQCALQECGIDLESRIGGKGSPNLQATINTFLDRVSALTYRYIYAHNGDNIAQECAINSLKSARDVIFQAMKSQLIYMASVGDLTLSTDKEIRKLYMDDTMNQKEYFNCSTYRKKKKKYCTSHQITAHAAMALIKSDIQYTIKFATENKETFMSILKEQAKAKSKRELESFIDGKEQAEKRIKALDKIIQNLYEDKVVGKISEERYMKMSDNYEAEQKALTERLNFLKAEIEKAKTQYDNINRFMAIVKRYSDFEEITPEILRAFVDKVIIHEKVKVNGHYVHTIEIIYNFVEAIDLPDFDAHLREEN